MHEDSGERGGNAPGLGGGDVLEAAEELQDHHAHAVLRDREHHLLGGERDGLGVVAVVHAVGERAEDGRDARGQLLASHRRQRAERLGVGGGDGRGGEDGDEEGEDDLAADIEELAEALEGVGGVVLQLLQQRRHDLLDGALPDRLEERVEGDGRRPAHLGLGVAERDADRRDHVVEVEGDLLARAVRHDLAETQAHARALQHVVHLESALEDGDHVAEHALPQLAHHLAHRLAGHRLLLLRGRREALDERNLTTLQHDAHISAPDELAQGPDLEARDADAGVHVGAEHVDGSQELVAALLAQHLPDLGLARLVAHPLLQVVNRRVPGVDLPVPDTPPNHTSAPNTRGCKTRLVLSTVGNACYLPVILESTSPRRCTEEERMRHASS
eukprot:350391-Rhodomonas_salina.1